VKVIDRTIGDLLSHTITVSIAVAGRTLGEVPSLHRAQVGVDIPSAMEPWACSTPSHTGPCACPRAIITPPTAHRGVALYTGSLVGAGVLIL